MEDRSKAGRGRERALATVLERRGDARVDAILASGDPYGVVGAMAKPEIFFTYAELEEELHRQVLVRLATAEQIDYLLDLDLWDRDRLSAPRLIEWIDRILGAGDEQALAWLRRVEPAFLVAAVKLLAEVYEGPAASQMALVEAQDALPPYSVEGIYYIHFRTKEGEKGLRRLLTLYASEDLEDYMALMQDVLGASLAVAEEDALEHRWRRLRDEGLEPAEAAYDIYRWPDAAELETLPSAPAEPVDETPDEEVSGAPTALALAAPTGLLAAAVERLGSDRDVRRVSRDIVRTSNLVLSADHLPLAELPSHAEAIAKTVGYVSIGLHAASAGEAERASEALRRTGSRLLFRMGYQRVAALGKRALRLRRSGWLSQLGLGLEVLDSPVGETVAALAAPRPAFAACLSGEGADREFRDHAEVERCSDVLDRAEALEVLFVEGLGLPLAPAAAFDLTDCHPGDPAELTLGLILRTAVANLVLDDALRFEPVEARRLPELPTLLLAEGTLRPEVRARARGELRRRMGQPAPGQLEHVEGFLDESLDILAAAFEGLEPGKPMDPRFVGAVIVRDRR